MKGQTSMEKILSDRQEFNDKSQPQANWEVSLIGCHGFTVFHFNETP